MLVQRGYKFELRLNHKERTSLLKGACIARFAWNWGLAKRIQRYNEQIGDERYTDAMKQHKLLNSLKKTEFPWMYEVSKCIPQEALRNLDQAFQAISLSPVAESSAETLKACEETVRPAYLQARLSEAGRQALAKVGHKRL
ncbi:MAG: helix-turn-helix domain-containing protein [Candidatus Hodarchaeales archaeon]|jgi:hypothetical protein